VHIGFKKTISAPLTWLFKLANIVF